METPTVKFIYIIKPINMRNLKRVLSESFLNESSPVLYATLVNVGFSTLRTGVFLNPNVGELSRWKFKQRKEKHSYTIKNKYSDITGVVEYSVYELPYDEDAKYLLKRYDINTDVKVLKAIIMPKCMFDMLSIAEDTGGFDGFDGFDTSTVRSYPS